MKKHGFIILSLSLLLLACESEIKYSETPEIKYKDFSFDLEDIGGFINPVGFLSFEFVDGNGDLGFPENSDTINNNEVYDILIAGYTKKNGSFVLTDTTDNSLLPYFKEGIYRTHLKGDMTVRIYLTSNQVGDTVKYDFQIMDRAYNLSNLESTPELIIPDL